SLWMTWEAQNRPQRTPTAPTQIAREAAPGADPATPGAGPAAAPAPDPTRETAPAPPPTVAEELSFENPQVRGVLSSRGAGIVRWDLREYTTPASEGGEPVPLIALEVEEIAAFATPFAELGLGDLSVAVFDVVERGPRMYAFALE